MQNSDFCIRIKSINGYQTSPAVLCMQISVISTRITSLYWYHISPVLLCMQNSVLSTRIKSLCGFQPSSVVFVHANQRLYHMNYQSLLIPALMCGFWMQNSDFWTGIASLYRSLTSPVVLCMQNSVISIRITSLQGSQPSSVVFGCKTATFVSE